MPVPVPSPTKECPFCTTSIPAAAKKCPQCREWIEAGAARQVARSRWEGNKVVLPHGTVISLPQCVICGGADGVRPWTKEFRYTPPVVYIGLIFGLLPAAILQMILMKREKLTLPRCAPCRKSMGWRTAIGWLVGLGGLFAFPFLGALIGQAFDTRDGAAAGAAIGFLVWFVALVVVAIMGSFGGVSCSLIDEGGVKLKFPKPDVTRRVLDGANTV